MAVVYRTILNADSPKNLDFLLFAVNEWLLDTRGISLQGDRDEVSAGDLTATLQRGRWGNEDVLEIVVTEGIGESTRLRVQAWCDVAECVFLIEEEERVGLGSSTSLPRPCQLALILASVTQCRVGVETVYSGARTIDEALDLRAWIAPRVDALPRVVLVGHRSRSVELVEALTARVTGMAHVLLVDSEIAGTLPAEQQTFTAGSVAMFDSSGQMVEFLPATVSRMQPDATARRMQRSLVELARRRLGPPALSHAVSRLHRAGGDSESWLGELERLEEQALQTSRELQSKADAQELLILEFDEALKDLDEAQRRVRYLETEVLRLGGYGLRNAEDEEELPLEVNYCSDSLTLAGELLPWLHICPTALRPAAELDEDQRCSVWAKRSWAGLRALNDYAKLKGDGLVMGGGFLRYCQDPPQGATGWPVGSLSMKESESTLGNAELRSRRVFEVPLAVDPSGLALMESHLKIARVGSPAPRLHFFDDTGGPTRKIYIGYLGQHLPTAG